MILKTIQKTEKQEKGVCERFVRLQDKDQSISYRPLKPFRDVSHVHWPHNMPHKVLMKLSQKEEASRRKPTKTLNACYKKLCRSFIIWTWSQRKKGGAFTQQLRTEVNVRKLVKNLWFMMLIVSWWWWWWYFQIVRAESLNYRHAYNESTENN